MFSRNLLMSCPGDSFANSVDLFENGAGCRRPEKWFRLGVAGINESLDVRYQALHAAKGSSPDGFLCDDVEPDLNLIMPEEYDGVL